MASDQTKSMRNEDFRKLLSTPSVRPSGTGMSATPLGGGAMAPTAAAAFTHRQQQQHANKAAGKGKKEKYRSSQRPAKGEEKEPDLVDESQAALTEIMKNYRDRAAERRKGEGLMSDTKEMEMRAKMTAAYRAVPATLSTNAAATSAAERRQLEIQSSKYLGGDIEHTHLVKGLDYSLLNKVRRELESAEEIDELEQAYEEKQMQLPDLGSSNGTSITNTITNPMARNLTRTLFATPEPPKRNSMFARGRMAYVVEIGGGGGDDVWEETDVPSTLMRSTFDCPADQDSEGINTDEVVINKLTQVLGYLRSENQKKKKGAEAPKPTSSASSTIQPTTSSTASQSMNIFDDVGEYVPSTRATTKDQRESSSKSSRPSLFDDLPGRRDEERSRHSRERDDRRRERDPKEPEKREEVVVSPKVEEPPAKKSKRRLDEEDAYSEYYPIQMMYSGDGGGDSDEDDVEYSKTDTSFKQRPRDTAPTSTATSSQYGGSKTEPQGGGRKARRAAAAQEKKLDREFGKIQTILDTRKKDGKQGGLKY